MYEVKNIIKSYNDLKVLEDISIDFPKNKTTCILGHSGCGKTTLLNILSGITKQDSGEIIGFKEDISFVFQDDRLIPWKNIKDNIKFVLKGKIGNEQIEDIINEYLKLVNLQEYKHYYPKELSGGMRQKISILRAFAYPSNLLIMDEPFKSLDINSKQILIDFLKELRIIENKTCIIVTHDIEESIALSHRIVILTEKPTKVKRVIELDDIKDKLQLKRLIERELTG
jgi:NitT/TauT family transport system ATP-binding protein